MIPAFGAAWFLHALYDILTDLIKAIDNKYDSKEYICMNVLILEIISFFATLKM